MNQEPQYHPISMLPTFTYMIDGELEAAEEQLPNLEAAALAKYAFRAEKPNNKDEAHELALIEAAIKQM